MSRVLAECVCAMLPALAGEGEARGGGPHRRTARGRRAGVAAVGSWRGGRGGGRDWRRGESSLGRGKERTESRSLARAGTRW